MEGLTLGNELDAPSSLLPKDMANADTRKVRFTDLDWNGHMNNCRYLDWVADLLPGQFHRDSWVREFNLCYINEAREGEDISLNWEMDSAGSLRVDAKRLGEGMSAKQERVFSARVQF